jgi:indole-3-glycerol phosphate synthase
VIVGLVDDRELDAMLACAAELLLFVLLEAFDAADLVRIDALGIDARKQTVLAGVNSRNLRDLSVDFERFGELAPLLPANLPCVAESGIANAGDVRRVAALGYRAALVGSALMTTPDPRAALRSLIDAGRAAAAGGTTCS